MAGRRTFASAEERLHYLLDTLDEQGDALAVLPAVGTGADITQIDAGDTAAAGATGRYADAGHQHALSPLVEAGGGTGTDYTPAWTATVTNPAIGNGTLTGRYRLIGGDLMYVTISLVPGSTTTLGSGNYSWSLPPGFKSRNIANFNQALGGYLVEASSSSRWVLAGDIRPNATVIVRAYSPGIVSNTAPVALATGDIFVLAGLVVVEAV